MAPLNDDVDYGSIHTSGMVPEMISYSVILDIIVFLNIDLVNQNGL